MKISLIVCADKRMGIGYRGEMLYRISEDLKRFKEFTFLHPVIMGYNTFKSIGKPLPCRLNIVMSKNHSELVCRDDFTTADEAFQNGMCWNKYVLVNSPEEALKVALKQCACSDSAYYEDEIFVIGGEQIYREFLRYADTIYFTFVESADGSFKEADTFFPTSVFKYDWRRRRDWRRRSVSVDPSTSEKETVRYRYETWTKKKRLMHSSI